MVLVKYTGEVYRCEKCGNIIEVMEPGSGHGELECCGTPMDLIEG